MFSHDVATESLWALRRQWCYARSTSATSHFVQLIQEISDPPDMTSRQN